MNLLMETMFLHKMKWNEMHNRSFDDVKYVFLILLEFQQTEQPQKYYTNFTDARTVLKSHVSY